MKMSATIAYEKNTKVESRSNWTKGRLLDRKHYSQWH